MSDIQDYKSQFGRVKESDLPKHERKPRKKKRHRKRTGVSLGKLLNEALK